MKEIVMDVQVDRKVVDELIRCVLTQPEFREKLLSAPEQALKEAGFAITPDLVNAIKAASVANVDALAGEYERALPGGSDDSGSGLMG